MKVAVVFGGESCEHDVSIITGVQLINKFNNYLYDIVPIYIAKGGVWYTGEELNDLDNYSVGLNYKKLKKCSLVAGSNVLHIIKGKKLVPYTEIDVVIPCMHGVRGEDGALSGVLELSHIPYTSCSLCSSAVSMDKGVFKTFAKGLGISVIDGFVVDYNEFLIDESKIIDKISDFGLPIIIKPCRQGSSIGIEVVKNVADMKKALNMAFQYDKRVLVEKYVDVDKEVNLALFDNKGELVVSSTETPLSSDEILSFDNKYRKNAGGFETIKRIMPASINEGAYCELLNMATKVYRGLDMFGVVRFDFILDRSGMLYLNEVNTIPGSMANYLFDKSKYPYPRLIELMISNAVKRFERDLGIKKTIDTDIVGSGIDFLKK